MVLAKLEHNATHSIQKLSLVYFAIFVHAEILKQFVTP